MDGWNGWTRWAGWTDRTRQDTQDRTGHGHPGTETRPICGELGRIPGHRAGTSEIRTPSVNAVGGLARLTALGCSIVGTFVDQSVMIVRAWVKQVWILC